MCIRDRRWSAGARLDYLLTRLTESLAALLVAFEVMILFAGVVSRYVFHNPLTWSDELASILFLWPVSYTHLDVYKRQEHGKPQKQDRSELVAPCERVVKYVT